MSLGTFFKLIRSLKTLPYMFDKCRTQIKFSITPYPRHDSHFSMAHSDETLTVFQMKKEQSHP